MWEGCQRLLRFSPKEGRAEMSSARIGGAGSEDSRCEAGLGMGWGRVRWGKSLGRLSTWGEAGAPFALEWLGPSALPPSLPGQDVGVISVGSL